MAQYVLGDKAVRQISALVNRFGVLDPGSASVPSRSNNDLLTHMVVGKLDTTLARGGTATLSIYSPSTAGGIGTDTNVNVTIADASMIPSASSPLPVNTVCMVSRVYGAWVLCAFDCEAV
jgi:hypothetical protein